MSADNNKHSLAHLQDQPDAEEEALVVDFDNLAVINVVVSNVSEWGCRLTSVDISELYKNVGIRVGDTGRLMKAQVTSVRGNDAAVLFLKTDKIVTDKRREKRNNVNIPVKVADLEGITEISGIIVDAGKNGCRISAKGLAALPEEVVLSMGKIERPVIAEFAWRTANAAGLRLLWNRTLEEFSNDEETQDA
ncbi:PilZ domain-containing protein [Roseibium marinum]|uniref:PilZ domain-containing protein n=1 Tax=Roseibium marinum TaxID=281252 RepID=A0A2S3ULM5_9HYPH|nr:PilZ domain-containing protein [Roseibium marinum]POF28614.1 PilZ domain-containing protein [Roseibium marinum]